ncbi:MAG: accessory factor UbiK family protein [Caulobacteraceae bacterium]
MQTKNPFLDDVAKAMEGAMSMAHAAGEEAKAAFRAQADRMAAELDLARRDELDALRARFEGEIAELRAQIARLTAAGEVARPSDDAG